jgi:hypothetical protein
VTESSRISDNSASSYFVDSFEAVASAGSMWASVLRHRDVFFGWHRSVHHSYSQ